MNAIAADAAKLPITVVILAYNEEIHIERCLKRLSGWVERIVVIDSFSTDRTVLRALELGAEVLQHRFKNHSDQFRWGLEAAQDKGQARLVQAFLDATRGRGPAPIPLAELEAVTAATLAIEEALRSR